MVIRWLGRWPTTEEQVANAPDSFVNLTPVSEAPAAAVRAGWAAWLPGQAIPLIGEDPYGYHED